MKENTLVVSEVFYSIQGEGQTIGTPAVFLRLAGCNLLCESEEWRCDTIEVWKKGRTREFFQVLSVELIDSLKNGANLVITGGEPLLQSVGIVGYLNWFREQYKFTPIIEIETNGTITPSRHLLDKVDYWNVSPKLPNSGEVFEKRVNEAAISTIQTFGRNKVFKFVVSNERDILEINDDYGFMFYNRNSPDCIANNIMLMPAGDSVESLAKTRLLCVELCKQFGYRYSDRLHISLWNKKTGV